MNNAGQGVSRRRKKWGKTAWMGLLFVIPAVSFSLVFDWYPMLDGIIKSFYDWNGYNTPTFVGLDNFIAMDKTRMLCISIPAAFLLFALSCLLSIQIYKKRHS